MDRLPLIPKNSTHDANSVIVELFRDVLRRAKYAKNVAENYCKYEVDEDFQDEKINGLNTIKIYEELETEMKEIRDTEKEILQSHLEYLNHKKNNLAFSEEIKLKRIPLLQKLSNEICTKFKLLQTNSIYPNFIERHLDFTFNPTLHTCSQHVVQKLEIPPENRTVRKKVPRNTITVTPFKAEPSEINFHNYVIGQSYHQKFKIRNVSHRTHDFHYYEIFDPFSVKLVTGEQRLAPGMSAEFLVTFHPLCYQNCQATVRFKTTKTDSLMVTITTSRDSPKLVCYVIDPLQMSVQNRDSKYFSERRQKALNFTIDCGTCFLGEHLVVAVLMKNEGPTGRFFLSSETEWGFCEIHDSPTRSIELIQGAFSIFPTFFEIKRQGFHHIVVVFVPEKLGVFTEKLYMICDNNTYQEVELLGDCINFSPTHLKLYLMENTFDYSNRTLRILLEPNETCTFIISIINKCTVQMSYYWALRNKIDDIKMIDPDWLKILNGTPHLPPLSTTDLAVCLNPQTDQVGLYHIYLSLYMKNIPQRATSDEEQECVTSSCCKLADVHLLDLCLFCDIQRPVVEELMTKTYVKPKIPEEPKLRILKTFINFGILPKNVTTTKHFFIENISNDSVHWKLIEVSCQNSSLSVLSDRGHLSQFEGNLAKGSRRKIIYSVNTQVVGEPYVSILLLFSCPGCTCQQFIVESACLVTYQSIEPKISLKTNRNSPILCPSDFLYVGIPSFHTIYVTNLAPITGCFYFCKQNYLDVSFEPQSGVVPPNGTVPVSVKILPKIDGIFDIEIPCFVGDLHKLMAIKIICNVGTINVQLYLPDCTKNYMIIRWPPRKDASYWTPISEKLMPEDQMGLVGEFVPESRDIDLCDDNITNLIAVNSVAFTYPTISTAPLIVKKCHKITFYIENLTPVPGTYTVNSSNYGPDFDCHNNVFVKAKTRPIESLYEIACGSYGLVIEPVPNSSDLVPFEVAQIDLYIYGNTWGKYLEEVIVEINDLTPFCFNLVVNLIGTPLEFPFARNTKLVLPTLRFQNIAYCSGDKTQSFTVTNTSSIPLSVNWYIFTPEERCAPFNYLVEFNEDKPNFTLTKEFYGCEACNKCISIEPCYMSLQNQATGTLNVTVGTTGFVSTIDSTKLRYHIVGFIDLEECYKFKENYFRRDCFESGAVKLEVLVTLQRPIMDVDLLGDETIMDIFVNDVLLTPYKFPQVFLVLRNNESAPVVFSVDIQKPFVVQGRTVPTGSTALNKITLQKNECLQLQVTCHFSHEDLLQFAEFIYQHNKDEITKNFTSVICKNLNVIQEGIPTQVRLHYPHIKIKPNYHKFGHCHLNCTKKVTFSVYNLTASPVNFEIYKTNKSSVFEVHPNHGEIPPSTGANHQFIDVAVYFTPHHCVNYGEKLRIVTNIAMYFLDFTMTGQGCNNEKFWT